MTSNSTFLTGACLGLFRHCRQFALAMVFGLGFVPVLLSTQTARAAPVTFDNETTFSLALLNLNRFDFETSSGFPIANSGSLNHFSAGVIGPFVGVNFDAHTYSGVAGSGSQSMTGTTLPGIPTGNPAIVSFTGMVQPPTGIGFFALDLTPGEKIVLEVDFSAGPDMSYDITLGGSAAFTPIFFGVLDSMDTIDHVRIFGTNIGENTPNRAWALDDMTIDGFLVPEPGTWGLGIAALAVAAVFARRMRFGMNCGGRGGTQRK